MEEMLTIPFVIILVVIMFDVTIGLYKRAEILSESNKKVINEYVQLNNTIVDNKTISTFLENDHEISKSTYDAINFINHIYHISQRESYTITNILKKMHSLNLEVILE